ncbi:MFS transporter [Actinokineospora sp. NBRC 105648]|uniref:MFS transporter n=1 Tax=Actinokineospora sp. NBRC 105648 TaxID=3032206 RepID=UPI0024A0BDA7|nr:MFS transporter [Actinokineospora sp. NBRC 105648]GLZ36791.1 hypothetical protein Acsp05_04160 [Actinokineospora sp. NBRC 105648]
MRAYIAAAALARTADDMVGVAVVLLVLDRTASPAQAGAMVTAYTLPSIVSGPLLGAWLDRTRFRRAVLAGGGVLLAATCVGLVWSVGRTPAVAFALAALTGLALPLTSGGYSSMVPHLVPADRLTRANSLDAATFNLGSIAGPALAGTLAATAGPAVAVLTIAALALSGALCTVALPTVAGGARGPVLRTVHAGLSHLVRTPPLRGATLTTVLGMGSAGVLATALPLWTAETGSGAAAAGYLWTALEVGCLVAVVALGRLLGARPERVVFACTAAYGLVMLTWPLAGGFAWMLALVGLAGVAEGLALPAIMGVRQRHTPPRLLAQVSTTGASLKVGGYALGAAAGGWLVPAAGPTAAITAVALAQLAAAALGLLAARGGERDPGLLD